MIRFAVLVAALLWMGAPPADAEEPQGLPGQDGASAADEAQAGAKEAEASASPPAQAEGGFVEDDEGIVPASDTAARLATVEGVLSRVSLLDIGPVVPGLAAQRHSAAPAGYVFYFLVERQPGVLGGPTLREVRDFITRGKRYSALTEAELGQAFEPWTIVEDTSKFLTIRPDLGDLVPHTDRGQIIVYTVLSGIELPAGTPGRVALRVGWGGSSEVFLFSFALP